jgi:hypothetical protein
LTLISRPLVSHILRAIGLMFSRSPRESHDAERFYLLPFSYQTRRWNLCKLPAILWVLDVLFRLLRTACLVCRVRHRTDCPAISTFPKASLVTSGNWVPSAKNTTDAALFCLNDQPRRDAVLWATKLAVAPVSSNAVTVWPFLARFRWLWRIIHVF